MTKEELLALGLTEEQIAEIFKINGKDVEKAKGDLGTKEAELASVNQQLEAANAEIDSFKEMDVEAIKKAADDYKAKYEQTKKDADAQIEALKVEHTIEGALKGAKNIKAAKALLDVEALKSSKNFNEDVQSAITALKESDPYLFEEASPTGTGGSLGGGSKQKGTSITKDEFNKMKYTDRVGLFNKNPELYNQLKE